MEGFRYKTEEELQDQIHLTTETLGTDISQASLGLEISKLPLEEIKAKYPERYEIYLKILRAQKNNQEVDVGELEEMQKWISSLNNLDSYIAKHSLHYDKFEARDKRQLDVFEDIRDSLEQGKKEGYIKLPTGVGKTVLFSRVVESLGLKTLIVVPSKILVGQTGERLEEFTDVEFGKFFQGEKNLSKNVTITTYLSLVRGIKNGTINPDEYHALILDEAHKALGEETSKAVRQFKGVKLGFTATPKFSEDKHVSDLLEHEIHSMGIVEAAKEGLISRFKSYIAYTDTDLSTVEVKNREKYDESELERAIDQEGRNQSAVELYKKEFDGQLAIAYCGGVTHAKHVAELFNASGISAEIISGDTPDDDGNPNGKKAILERFRTGQTKVLCNARILIEGFDEPKASVCLNLQPTLSLVDAEQRAGRVLRIDSENPDKWAYIVDFIDRDPRVAPRTFAEIAEASEVDGEYAMTFDMDHTGNIAGGEREERERIPDVDIKGLRVVVDAREVLNITQSFREDRYIQENKRISITLEDLRFFCKENDISSSSKYDVFMQDQEKSMITVGMPKDKDLLRGYLFRLGLTLNEFFGKERQEKYTITFEDLRVFCSKHNINSTSEYEDFVSNQENKDLLTGMPKNKEGLRGFVIKNCNSSINELFGKQKLEKITATLEELRSFCKEYGISSGPEYNAFAKDLKNKVLMEGKPKTTVSLTGFLVKYKLTTNQLFGKEKKRFLISLNDLRSFCAENNITSGLEYVNFAINPDNKNLMEGKPASKSSLTDFVNKYDLTVNQFFGKEKRGGGK